MGGELAESALRTEHIEVVAVGDVVEEYLCGGVGGLVGGDDDAVVDDGGDDIVALPGVLHGAALLSVGEGVLGQQTAVAVVGVVDKGVIAEGVVVDGEPVDLHDAATAVEGAVEGAVFGAAAVVDKDGTVGVGEGVLPDFVARGVGDAGLTTCTKDILFL